MQFKNSRRNSQAGGLSGELSYVHFFVLYEKIIGLFEQIMWKLLEISSLIFILKWTKMFCKYWN